MIIENRPQIGAPSLRKKSKKVSSIKSPKTQEIIANLIETFEASSLVGMAAPQIGHDMRMFVSQVRATKNRAPDELSELVLYINPTIVRLSKEKVIDYEGCGSVIEGKIFGPVKRSQKVTVEASDKNGKKFFLSAHGLLARIIQHEYDHLEGILFTDRVTDNTQLISVEEYRKKNKK